MKLNYYLLLTLSLTFVACSTDHLHNSINDESHNQPLNTYSTHTSTAYSLETILDGMRSWQNIRTETTTLTDLFTNVNSITFDMSLFPDHAKVHAYPCLINSELKYVLISEVYDDIAYHDSLINYIQVVDPIYTETSQLFNSSYESHSYTLPTQYIEANDALNRIDRWNVNYNQWIAATDTIYESMEIPTYNLTAKSYTAYFGLKEGEDGSANQLAGDLVIHDQAGLFFDTVLLIPPHRPHRPKFYLVELL